MKDPAHHRQQLNRRVIRSMRREKLQQEAYELTLPLEPQHLSPTQEKKQKKIQLAQARKARALIVPTQDERNRQQKKRSPVFDPMSHIKPQKTKTRKKTPPL